MFSAFEKRLARHQANAEQHEAVTIETHNALPFKLARGVPVAQEILPFEGERLTRSLCGLPTHRCRPVPFVEPCISVSLGGGSVVGEEATEQENPAQQPSEMSENGARQRRLKIHRRVNGCSGQTRSHMYKPRSYSDTESLWKDPRIVRTVKPRVFERAGYLPTPDGMIITRKSFQSRFTAEDGEFDRLTVRELMTRSVEPGQRPPGSESSSRLPSRRQLRSHSGPGMPPWATAKRTSTRVLGDPSKCSTCIIQPMTPASDEAKPFVPLDSSWMTRVPNLGRVTDPYCLHLTSEPLYCHNLEHARNGREPHMISSGGLYCGGPVYNINFSQAIRKY